MRKRKDKADIDRELEKIDEGLIESVVARNNYERNAILKELVEHYPFLADKDVMEVFEKKQRERAARELSENADRYLLEAEWMRRVIYKRHVIAKVISLLDDLFDNDEMIRFIRNNKEVRKLYRDLIDTLGSDNRSFGEDIHHWYDIRRGYLDHGWFDKSEHKGEIEANVEMCHEMLVCDVLSATPTLHAMHDKIVINGDHENT